MAEMLAFETLQALETITFLSAPVLDVPHSAAYIL